MTEWLGESVVCGRRRKFVLRVLSARGSYPDLSFERNGALYQATPSLVYTVVPSEPPNDWGWNELAWADVGEIRFWGALAFSIPEGKGFYAFTRSRKATQSRKRFGRRR